MLYLIFLGDVDVTVQWSICLSVMLVHCAQTAQDIDTIFLYTTAPRLSQITLKFALHQFTVSSLIFASKWPPPVDLSVGDIRRQIVAAWLDIANSHNGQPIGNHRRLSEFRMVPSLTRTTPKTDAPNAPKDQLRDACCHLANMIDGIDKSWAISPFAKLTIFNSPRMVAKSEIQQKQID